jgi:hypothetical protein
MKVKRYNSLNEWLDYPENVRTFIHIWQKNKGYRISPILSIGDWYELCLDVTNKHHLDDILDGVRDHLIREENFTLGYDGEEFLDVLAYDTVANIKRRIRNYRPA